MTEMPALYVVSNIDPDSERMLDGWCATAGKLANLRDDYRELKAENDFLLLSVSVAVQCLEDLVPQHGDPKHKAALERLRNCLKGNRR